MNHYYIFLGLIFKTSFNILNIFSCITIYQDELPDLSALWSSLDLSDPNSFMTNSTMQTIFELDGQCNVVLQGKIGQVQYKLFLIKYMSK